MFLNYLKNFLTNEKCEHANIAVALSGGADSVALFFALKSLSREFSLSLAVIHVNYQLRGIDSQNDYEFVAAIAKEADVPFYSKTVSLDAAGNGVEEQARKIRYAFFREIQEREGFPFVAVGHTRDDQAETVLFRLLRGTALHGAAGMEAVRDDGIIRPILQAGREECRKWLIENGIPWREDLSNQDNHYRRNLIRNKILPLIREVNPGAVEHLAGFAQHCSCVNDELLAIGMERLRSRGLREDRELFHFDKRGGFDEATLTAVASLLRSRGCSFSEQHMRTLSTAAERCGKTTLLPGGWRIFSSYRKLIFFTEGNTPFTSFEIPVADLVDGVVLYGLYRIDSERFAPHAVVRSVKCGEVFSVNGREKKVSAFLKKRGVPSLERQNFPVVSVNGKIVSVVTP